MARFLSTSQVDLSKIIYTECDEAPMLATYSLLPVIQRFAKPMGIEVSAGRQQLIRLCRASSIYINPSENLRYTSIVRILCGAHKLAYIDIAFSSKVTTLNFGYSNVKHSVCPRHTECESQFSNITKATDHLSLRTCSN